MGAALKPFRSFPDMGIDVWLTFDHGAQVYELWVGGPGEECIGQADTIAEANQVCNDYFEELMA